MCPSEGGCAPVWEGVSLCGRVCPSVGMRPVCEGVCACVCMCMCVYLCVSLPSVLMGDVGEECVQVYMCMSVIVTCTYLCISM